MTYIDPPLETNADELAAEAIDYLIENLSGFVPQEGHLEIWWIEALSRLVAEARDVASRVPRSIFRFTGLLYNLPPIDAAPSHTASTWTMKDNSGYTIEAGTLVGFEITGDETIAYSVDEDVVVEPGSLTTNVGGVLLTAVEPGAHTNDIPAGPMVAIDSVDYLADVDPIVATSPVTAGGVDAESDDTYLSRLTDEFAIASPRPILPRDFAVLSRRMPGVHRAVAIDGWNPDTATDGNARTISVAVVDAEGQPVAIGIKDDVDDMLTAMRELNWLTFVIDPSYTAIDVTFVAIAKPGYDPDEVEVAAEEAVTDYLDPAGWAGGAESPPVWRDETIVRYGEIWSLIDQVEGVDYLELLQVEGGVVNIDLVGRAPLTQAGVIDGTVNSG